MEDNKFIDNLKTSLDSLDKGRMKINDTRDSFIIGFILSYFLSKSNSTLSSKEFEKIKNGFYRTKLESDSEEETLLVFSDRIVKETFKNRENIVYPVIDHQEINLINSDVNNNNNFLAQKKNNSNKKETLSNTILKSESKINTNSDVNDYIECEICCENFSIFDPKNVDLQNCNCFIHYDCFVAYLENEINFNKVPILCPVATCKKEIPMMVIDWSLKDKPELLTKLEKFTFNNYITMNSDKVSCCPTPGCEYLFFFEKKDGIHFSCPLCKKHYCLKCKVDYHFNMNCEDHFKLTDKKSLDNEFEKFAKGHKYKQCPNCKFWVAKNKGCNHMTCICKHEFCYVCGVSYKNRVPKCKCRI